MSKFFLLILTFFFLPSCSNDPSHLPSIWSLPTAVVTNTIENSVYNSKRNKVKNYITSHYDALKPEIKRGEGFHLTELLVKAGVDNKVIAQKQLQADYAVMFENIELMTGSMMNKYSSLYINESKEKLKTINGYSYTQASGIIELYLMQNFEKFRQSLYHKNPSHLQTLADQLNIKNQGRRAIFLAFILEQYDVYFIEPAVVAVMVVAY